MTGKKGMTWRKKNVKYEYDKAIAAEKGRLQAQEKAHQKKPLLDSAREHIGKMLDKEGVDAVICTGLAVLGYEKTGDWKGALIGPVAYKLATAKSEVAAVAGTLTLATFLGITLGGTLFKELQDFMFNVSQTGRVTPTEDEDGNMACAEGYTLMKRPAAPFGIGGLGGQLVCVDNAMVAFLEGMGYTKPPPPPHEESTGPLPTEPG